MRDLECSDDRYFWRCLNRAWIGGYSVSVRLRDKEGVVIKGLVRELGDSMVSLECDAFQLPYNQEAGMEQLDGTEIFKAQVSDISQLTVPTAALDESGF